MSDGLRLPVIIKIRQDVDADDPIRIGCINIGINLEPLADTPDF